MQFQINASPEFLQVLARLDRLRNRTADDRVRFDDPLRRRERIRSVGASCRLAGIRYTDEQVAACLDSEEEGRGSCDEQELRGYATALAWEPLDQSTLLSELDLQRLHAVMIGGDGSTGTAWRNESAYREAFTADGVAMGRIFQTLPPRLVPSKIDELLTWFEWEMRRRRQPEPLLIGVFSLVLLAASPFDRGNGRFSRLVFVRLMRRAGYRYFDGAAWEPTVEATREEYFASYDFAATYLWSGDADVTAWSSYLLRTLADQAKTLERTLQPQTVPGQTLSELQKKILETMSMHETVQASLLMERTGANRNTLKDNMRKLVDGGLVEKIGERRGTRYRLRGQV